MRVGIVAGEASGDYLGATLIRAIRQRWPAARFEGILGPKMLQEGGTSFFPMEKLAVRGYTEVLRHLPELLSIRRQLKKTWIQNPPDLFIGVDAPDFNLGLEASLKARGIPTLHCVCPTVWAWRKNRFPAIRRAAHHVLTVFPFEPPLLHQEGIAASFMGHPLAMDLPNPPQRQAMRERLKLSQSGPVVALLPGSRVSELRLHAALFVDTAIRFHQAFPQVQFLVPLISRDTYDIFMKALWLKTEHAPLPITVMHGHAAEALTASDLALVASGTATLEAALAGCPMVVTYRLSRLTAFWVRLKQHLPFVSLPNILLKQWVVPELLQEEARPSTLARALSSLYLNQEARRDLEGVFSRLHEELSADTSSVIVAAISKVLGGVG